MTTETEFRYTVYCNVQYPVTLSNSIKLVQVPMLQSAVDSDQDSVSPGSLQFQNKERTYRQKLQVYQEAQQRQAQLVQKLQTKVTRKWTSQFRKHYMKKKKFLWLNCAPYVCFIHKVLQYKKRCGRLEEQVLGKTSESEKTRLLVRQESVLLRYEYRCWSYN